MKIKPKKKKRNEEERRREKQQIEMKYKCDLDWLCVELVWSRFV